MAIERWIQITICLIGQKPDGSPDYHAPKEILSSYDLPRKLYERRQWVITWRFAWWQCRYPRRYIRLTSHFYDKKTGENLLCFAKMRIASRKGMITKIANQLREYEAARAKELFWEKDQDEVYQKGVRKLRKYQEELELLELDRKNA